LIAIVSDSTPERIAFVSLCESRGWVYIECSSVHAFKQFLRRTRPTVILTRDQFTDGFSDHIIAAVNSGGFASTTKTIVLAGAGMTPAAEARQIALGADCVQRDPVRSEVVVAYIAKYLGSPRQTTSSVGPPGPTELEFAGVPFDPIERNLGLGQQKITLTPREAALVDVLIHHQGRLVSYETLFSEVLERRFNADTSNMRVLLGKLNTSTQLIGIDARDWVQVVPKTGYLYHGTPLSTIVVRAKNAPA